MSFGAYQLFSLC